MAWLAWLSRLVSVLSPSWQTVWPAPAPRGDCEEQTALTGLSPSLPALCGPPTRHNCLTSPDLSCNTNISPVEIICSKTPNKISDERSIKILLTASFRWYETNPNNYVPSRNSSSLKNFYFKLIIRSIITLSNFKSVPTWTTYCLFCVWVVSLILLGVSTLLL